MTARPLDRGTGAAQRVSLSPAQERLWFAEQSDGLGPAAGHPVAMLIEGPVDEEALLGAVRGLVRRHAALRTTFASGPEGVVQLVHDDGEPEIILVDAPGASDEVLGQMLSERLMGPMNLV
jgi:hypothetical protein